MKKILFTLVAIILLTGCGNEITNLDLNKASNTIEESLKEMQAIEDSTLEDVYGLDLSKMEEYVIKQNNNGDLYAIIKTTDKVAVKEDMDEYFEKIKEFNTAYSPERLQILEDRLEKEVGDFLVYIIAEDADTIYKNVLDDME